jgi:hypothetical protein
VAWLATSLILGQQQWGAVKQQKQQQQQQQQQQQEGELVREGGGATSAAAGPSWCHESAGGGVSGVEVMPLGRGVIVLLLFVAHAAAA